MEANVPDHRSDDPRLSRVRFNSVNTERLTTKSREVIRAAVETAAQRGHATVEPWHLLLSLLDTGGSTAGALLRAVGANPAEVRRHAIRAIEQLPSARGASVTEPTLSRELINAIKAAGQIARPLGDEYVSTEHLLAGVAQIGGAARPCFDRPAPPARRSSRPSRRSAAATVG